MATLKRAVSIHLDMFEDDMLGSMNLHVEARKKAANLSVVVFLVNHFVEAIDADAGAVLVGVTLQTIQGSIRPLLVFCLLSWGIPTPKSRPILLF